MFASWYNAEKLNDQQVGNARVDKYTGTRMVMMCVDVVMDPFFFLLQVLVDFPDRVATAGLGRCLVARDGE